jgi:uncharacterized protein (TIGR03067 family)
MEDASQPQPKERFEDVDMRIAIDGTKLTIETTTADGRVLAQEMTFVLDPTQSPHAIDATRKGRTVRGVYELDGDKLKLCIDRGGTRPKGFATAKNTEEIA